MLADAEIGKYLWYPIKLWSTLLTGPVLLKQEIVYIPKWNSQQLKFWEILTKSGNGLSQKYADVEWNL